MQVTLRRAGTWAPLLQRCTSTPLSSSNKIPRNSMGLKITACLCSWGKFWTKRYKRPKQFNCHFWRAGNKNRVLGAKAGHCACPLQSTPRKGWADHLSHASSQAPGHTPTLSAYKEPAPSPSRSQRAREPVTCSRFPRCSRGPSKALPEFLLWPRINFYWLGKAQNPGRHQRDPGHIY